MGIFNIFIKKAKLSLILEKEVFLCGELIKGKIVITPLDDFTSNNLNIGISIYNFEAEREKEVKLDDIDETTDFIKLSIPSKNYIKGIETFENFEFSISEYEKLVEESGNLEYVINHKEKKMEIFGNYEYKILGYDIFAKFNIPGFDVEVKERIYLK